MENSCISSHSNIKVFITDFINEDKCVYYKIVILCLNSSKTWEIKARYSLISELNCQIKEYLKKNKNILVKLPEFPSKKWWAVQNEEFLDQRKKELQIYLSQLLQQPDSLLIEPLQQFLCSTQNDEECDEDLSIYDKLNLIKSSHQINLLKNTSDTSHTNHAVCENCEEQDKFSVDYEMNFPFSFCELSMEKKNQQFFLNSFEEIQSIRRQSIDQQSDFNDNNSTIMYFLASPTSLKQGPMILSRYSNGKEEGVTPTSIQQKSNRFIQEPIKEVNDFDQEENYSSFVQKAVNCINRKKTMQSNVYNYNLEEYKQTQRNFRREVEQIIDSSGISSGIEQNLFFDSDQEEEDQNNSRTKISNKQNENQLQKIPYNSDSDSDCSDVNSVQDRSNYRKSNQSQKSYTKSLEQNSKILTPNMYRSTDDDCIQNKRRISKTKRHKSQEIQISDSATHYFNSNNSCCFLQECKDNSLSCKHNISDNILHQDESLEYNTSSSQFSSHGESTNTIFHKSNDGQQDILNDKSNILKDISFQSLNSMSSRSPTIQLTKNQQQNILISQ